MTKQEHKELIDELAAIKQRLSNIENKLIQINVPENNTFNQPACWHEFIQTTAGQQCRKCGMLTTVVVGNVQM